MSSKVLTLATTGKITEVDKLFTSPITANTTVGNSATEADLFSVTRAANFWQTGKTIRVKASGFVSFNTASTLTLRLQDGTSNQFMVATLAATALQSNVAWDLDITLTARSTSTVMSNGWAQTSDISTTTNVVRSVNVNTAAVTVDVPASSQNLHLEAQWGAASANSSVTITNLTIEILN